MCLAVLTEYQVAMEGWTDRCVDHILLFVFLSVLRTLW